MSQRADLVPVAPEEGAVRLNVGIAGGGDGSAVAGERLPSATSTQDDVWFMAAVSGDGQGETAARVVGDLRNALSHTALDDSGAAMKQAFRKINSALYQQGMGNQTASAVALVTRGKYATIANIGEGRAYLMRAGRLNQVTRDITPTPLKSSGKGKTAPAEDAKPTTPVLLGTRERLDSRQPAIYELTLLPEDRVLLCTATVHRTMDEQAVLANLAGEDVEQSLALLSQGAGGGAVVATVSAARLREPVIVTSEGQTSALPIVAALVLIVLLIAAYIVYTMFL